MRKLLIYIMLITGLQSCEEKTDWPLQQGNLDFVVVDGIITDEMQVQSIYISRPVSEINEPAMPVSDATVLVSADQTVYTFSEDQARKGYYISNAAFKGESNKTYTLNITDGTNLYSAKAVLAPPEDSPFIGFEKNDSDENYHFTDLPYTYNPDHSAMFEIFLDWSSAPGYETSDPELCRAKLYYYVLKTIDVSEIFAPRTEKITFPYGTVITERRYSLTDQHAAFLRAVLLETSWQGGFFNTATANIPTNLSTGAAGFFGACGVVEKKETVK